MLPGRGVSATVAGHHLVAGNRELLTEEHVPWESLSQAAVPALEQGCTVTYPDINEFKTFASNWYAEHPDVTADWDMDLYNRIQDAA